MRGANIHVRGLTWEEIERLPLMALHAMLARYEARIEARLQELGGELLQRWNDVRVPDDVRRIWGVDGMETTYFRLAEIVVKREQAEVRALIAEFRQSADPAIAQVIAEAIDIERKLP